MWEMWKEVRSMWKTSLYDTSKLTVELRDIIKSGTDIWDFEYDGFYTGDAKKTFEQKVIDHYYFRQIGQETVGRFKHEFKTKIREIMPYYKQLYESVELMANVGDPFEAYNLTETFERSTTANGKVNGSESSESSATGTSESTQKNTIAGSDEITSNNKTRFSDTPQGSIDNLDTYMTNATIVDGFSETGSHKVEDITESTENSSSGTSSGSHSTTSEDTGTESYTMTRRGNIGVQPLGQEMEYYRKALINVDMMIINELNELFLLVY